MNNLSLFPAIVPTMIDTTAKTPSRFIESNTREMDFLNLRRDCIIPVFSKDNESTICHTQFIEAMVSAVTGFFRHDAVLRPAVRVSHPIKGRIPELFLTDAQINQVVKGLYQNPAHGCQGGSISLWNLYNLFTDAVKSSYIDSFLDRNLNATNFSLVLQDVLENAGTCWYLN